jgi:HEAT repeat protein
MLEYGERVECMECIPLLERKLLVAEDARVREIAAWWLRRRPFGYGRIAVRVRSVLAEDADPVRRSRAAEALGEFLDVGGLPALSRAVLEDSSAEVRLSSVRALGRLNASAGQTALVTAFEDEDALVRRAALDQVLRVSFWQDEAALVARLGDDDASVRQRAAQLVGERDVEAAVGPLAERLGSDEAPAVRIAAAWALGRIGGDEAVTALREASESERDPGVQDALSVALAM